MSLNPEALTAILHRASPQGRLEALQKALIETSDTMLAGYVQFASAAITEGNVDMYMRYLAQAEGWLHAIDTAADAGRGAKQFEDASRGGNSKRGKFTLKTKLVLECMADAIARQPIKGIKWAAQVAYLKQLGSSVEANRQLWRRHNQKGGTSSEA